MFVKYVTLPCSQTKMASIRFLRNYNGHRSLTSLKGVKYIVPCGAVVAVW